jgi:hypothetical protein
VCGVNILGACRSNSSGFIPQPLSETSTKRLLYTDRKALALRSVGWPVTAGTSIFLNHQRSQQTKYFFR